MEVKAPFYNVVNILLPGLVFIGASVLIFLDDFIDIAERIIAIGSAGLEALLTIAVLAIAYQVGYIIFRLGAMFIEPLLKKMFGWTSYGEFVEVQKAGRLDMLSREYAYARTHIALFIALAVMAGIRAHWIPMILCLLCVALFALTARGHIKKIAITVNSYQK